jgi:hypothetical protein
MTEISRLEVEADARKQQFDRSLDILRRKASGKGFAEEILKQVDRVKPGMADTLVRSSREDPIRVLSFAAVAAVLMGEALKPPKRQRTRSKALTLPRRNRIKGE